MPGGVAVPNPRGFADECACAVDVDEFKKRQDQFKRREEGAAGAGAGDVSIGGSDVVARVLMCCCRCGTVQYYYVVVVCEYDGCTSIARAVT
jgi:hypothetical protein